MKLSSSKIFKSLFGFAVGESATKLLNFILVPLAAFYITADQFSSFYLMYFSVTILSAFFNICIWEANFRYRRRNKSYIRSGNLLLVFLGYNVLIFSLLLALSDVVFAVLYLTSSAFIYIQYELRARGHVFLYGVLNMSNALLLLLGLLVITKTQMTPHYFLPITYILANTLVVTFFILFLKFDFNTTDIINKDVLIFKKYAMYSFPLVANYAVWWFYYGGFILLFEKFNYSLSTTELTVAIRLFGIFSVISSILMLTLQHWRFERSSSVSIGYLKAVVKGSVVMVPIAMVLAIVMQKFIFYVLPSDFFVSVQLMLAFSVLAVLLTLNQVMGSELLASENSIILMKSSIVGVLVTVFCFHFSYILWEVKSPHVVLLLCFGVLFCISWRIYELYLVAKGSE